MGVSNACTLRLVGLNYKVQVVENFKMQFSIVTPSFRNSQWLRLCIASVADQQGVEFEHIIQDACSDDGTRDWLPHDRRVRAFIEKILVCTTPSTGGTGAHGGIYLPT